MSDRLSLKGILVLLAALLLALSGCGDSGANEEELQQARKEGAAKAQQQAKIRQIQKELKELRKEGGRASRPTTPDPSVSPAPESTASTSGNCGGSLSANENTTCGFAEEVEEAYYSEIGSGAGTVVAWSPTTEQYYDMYCTAGSPHECTGGNNAAVYFP